MGDGAVGDWASLSRGTLGDRVAGGWPAALAALILYASLIALSTAANSFVVFIVLKYKNLHSVTNYFLVNLSVADLLVTLVCMPIAVAFFLAPKVWLMGETMWKLTGYLQGVAAGASVYTIATMSVDRYLVVRSSMSCRKVLDNRRIAVVVLISLWVIPLLVCSPLLWSRRLVVEVIEEGNLTLVYGTEDWSDLPSLKHAFGLVFFFALYVIPGFLVTFCYILMSRVLLGLRPPADVVDPRQMRLVEERRRITRLLITLVLVFDLCWLPHNIINLLYDLDLDIDHEVVILYYPFALLLGHANSAINPLLYCFLLNNFRKVMRRFFRRRRRLQAKGTRSSTSSRMTQSRTGSSRNTALTSV